MMSFFSGPIYTKVKAAFLSAVLVAALALIDQLSALDLSVLGPWAIPAGGLLAAAVAFAKKEIAGHETPSFDPVQPDHIDAP